MGLEPKLPGNTGEHRGLYAVDFIEDFPRRSPVFPRFVPGFVPEKVAGGRLDNMNTEYNSTMEKTKHSTRGGARPGSGRPPIADGQTTVPFVVRMTQAQRAHLVDSLGGAEWVRGQIDQAMARQSEAPRAAS